MLSVRNVYRTTRWKNCYLLSERIFSTTDNGKKKENALVSSSKEAFRTATKFVMNPKESWVLIKDTANHYWIGSKLLWSEIKVANQIMNRLLQGHGMTRRERMQLLRTMTDIFRLVPFAIFVIVPFMEFLLPFALKLFPNMLPSTFQDSLKREESMKQELQMRLAIAKFMQETLQEMATKKSSQNGTNSSGAKEVLDFIEKARLGEPISNESVIKIARLFKDELTLANVTRPQLASMCRYMGLQQYGADAFLRFQLRTKFKGIKEDDRRILWEGIDSLNTVELRDACSERGMRSYGLTHFKLKTQLQEWLSLSIQKNIPISLLIMSRAFMLTSPSDDAEQLLKNSLSSLDSDTINEVVVAVASSGEQNTLDIRLRKLDSIQFQKEMIDDEREEWKDAYSVKEVLKPNTDESETKGRSLNVDSTSTEIAAIPHAEHRDEKKELTIYEMQTISDLARGSSVLREKTELAIIQANVDYGHEDELLLSQCKIGSSINEKISSDDEKGLTRMRNVMNLMLDKLKIKIDTTEQALGDKLNLLDKDGDGELSSEELKSAITKILKRTSTVEEVDELIATLDINNDGKVSLAELLAYIKKKSEDSEIGTLTLPGNGASKEDI